MTWLGIRLKPHEFEADIDLIRIECTEGEFDRYRNVTPDPCLLFFAKKLPDLPFARLSKKFLLFLFCSLLDVGVIF